jgi:kynurenine formamidase
VILKDLSQTFANGMPHAATIPAPCFRQVMSVERDGLSVTQLSFATHVGTHIDAPSHFIEGGGTAQDIALETLVGPAVAVAVQKSGGEEISAEDLARVAGDARPGDALLIRTGWGERFGGEDYHDHPYLSEEAARWVVGQGFRLVGLDTVTPDMPPHRRPAEGFGFPVHRTLLGNGVLVMEHLYLEEVAGERFDLFVGSLKIQDADGAPARVLAVFEGPR